MKNVFTLIILLLSGVLLQAQSFRESDTYVVKTTLTDKPFEYEPYVLQLYEIADRTIVLADFGVTQHELLESIRISTLTDTGLDGIAEVIRVEVEYLSCCSQVEAHYFMRTTKNEMITLPQLTNTYCEDTDRDIHYIFPGQAHGEEGLIVKGLYVYNEQQQIEQVQIQRSIAWNDDHFENTVIAYGYEE